jgi:hypothetical protein
MSLIAPLKRIRIVRRIDVSFRYVCLCSGRHRRQSVREHISACGENVVRNFVPYAESGFNLIYPVDINSKCDVVGMVGGYPQVWLCCATESARCSRD